MNNLTPVEMGIIDDDYYEGDSSSRYRIHPKRHQRARQGFGGDLLQDDIK